jgi:hypothetical protein
MDSRQKRKTSKQGAKKLRAFLKRRAARGRTQRSSARASSFQGKAFASGTNAGSAAAAAKSLGRLAGINRKAAAGQGVVNAMSDAAKQQIMGIIKSSSDYVKSLGDLAAEVTKAKQATIDAQLEYNKQLVAMFGKARRDISDEDKAQAAAAAAALQAAIAASAAATAAAAASSGQQTAAQKAALAADAAAASAAAAQAQAGAAGALQAGFAAAAAAAQALSNMLASGQQALANFNAGIAAATGAIAGILPGLIKAGVVNDADLEYIWYCRGCNGTTTDCNCGYATGGTPEEFEGATTLDSASWAAAKSESITKGGGVAAYQVNNRSIYEAPKEIANIIRRNLPETIGGIQTKYLGDPNWKVELFHAGPVFKCPEAAGQHSIGKCATKECNPSNPWHCPDTGIPRTQPQQIDADGLVLKKGDDKEEHVITPCRDAKRIVWEKKNGRGSTSIAAGGFGNAAECEAATNGIIIEALMVFAEKAILAKAAGPP